MNIPELLSIDSTILILIDYQERLFPAMHDKGNLLSNVLKLVEGIRCLGIPIILTEQYPKGLGATLPEIKAMLPDVTALEKICFNCCDNENFCTALEHSGRHQVLLAGIEAHICIYQTAIGLARKGYQVNVVSDCTSSRDPDNKKAAIDRLIAYAMPPTTTEMALFELVKTGSGDIFKRISSIVK